MMQIGKPVVARKVSQNVYFSSKTAPDGRFFRTEDLTAPDVFVLLRFSEN
jgi:hypothetical protein